MATKTILVDDLNDELTADETITFGLDGATYDIDLTTENGKRLRDALAEFIAAGRRIGAKTPAKSPKKPSAAPKTDSGEIREWARKEGLKVSDRGRIPVEVLEAWEGHKGDLAVKEKLSAEGIEENTPEPAVTKDASDVDHTDQPATPTKAPTDKVVLAWHKAKSYKIPDNGKVSGLMRARYVKAHAPK